MFFNSGLIMTLDLFQKSKVLVVGDVMLDRYLQGQAERISPEAPVPIVHIESTQESSKAYPGGAANVSVNIQSLGAQALLLGKIGCDEAGEQLKSLLTQAGIQHFLQEDAQRTTITKLRVLSHHQQLLRLDFEQRLYDTDDAMLLQTYQTLLPMIDCIILSDYGKGTLKQSAQLIALAKNAGKPILVDPKGSDFQRYRHATLLSPNRKEFEAIVGPCYNDQMIIERGLKLQHELELDALLITRGAEGMTLLHAHNPPLHLAATSHEVFDVSGAGDTVIATLAAGYGAGLPWPEAVRIANAAAGIVVTKLGTATVSPQELSHALHPEDLDTKGVIALPELLKQLRCARARSERIIMTNGCFDLLHYGHVHYLQQARQLGDRLIVAINSDASIQRLKGPSRPILPLEQRMHVLAALEAVDWVVAFDDDTPLDLIKHINPDILVKGEDYQIENIAGSEWLRAQGKEIRLLPFVPGCSSSAIIKKIESNFRNFEE